MYIHTCTYICLYVRLYYNKIVCIMYIYENTQQQREREKTCRSCQACPIDVWRQNITTRSHKHAHIDPHIHIHRNVCVCLCKWFSGSAHERKLKMVENNICVVVSILNGSIQNLSIRHATFLISNSYVRYVNKLLRIFAHLHTHTNTYIHTNIYMPM